MKRIAICVCGALAAAACSMSSEADRLENAMRETLAARGTVQQIEMTKDSDSHMSGFAMIRAPNATADSRLNCSADLDPTKGESYYNWRCVPTIDEALLTEMENAIRQSLSQQATVETVEMTRRDDDHMAGYATVRDAGGNQLRTNCTATRDNSDQGNFTWECEAAGQGAE